MILRPMSATEKAQAEALAQQADVRRALEEAATHKVSAETPVQPKQKVWLGTYATLLLGLGGLYYLLRLKAFGAIPFQVFCSGLHSARWRSCWSSE